MEVNFSLFDSNDLLTTSTALLQIILDNIPTSVEVLKAVRRDNVIVDFEYILVNEASQKRSRKKLLGKKFLGRSENDPHLFSRMIEVTETGNPFQVLVTTEAYGSLRWFIHKYVKFEDGLIVSKEDITEKKLSEQNAIESQQFIESIADSTPDIIYVLDLETRSILYMNNRGYEILGITAAEIKEKGHDIFFQVTHPDDYIRRMNHFTEVGKQSSDSIQAIEIKKRIKDGSYHWFRIRDKVFKRKTDGTAISIIGISTDIHEQKKQEDELVQLKDEVTKRATDRYYALFNSIDQGFCTIELAFDENNKPVDYRFLEVSPSFEHQTGIINGAGRWMREIAATQDEFWFETYGRVAVTRNPERFEYFSTPLARWWSVFAFPIDDPQLRHVAILFNDITERKQTDIEEKKNMEQSRKEALHTTSMQNASLENFKLIADNAYDGIISMDRDGRVNYWNPAACLIYGYNSEEAMGKKLDELIAIEKKKPDLAQAMTQVYHHGDRVVDLYTQKRKKDGRQIEVIINLFPIKDETGDITGSCMVTKDISETRVAREKMKEDAHFIGQMLDTTADIIYIMDLNTYQTIYTNRRVADDLGYTKAQIAAMKNPILDLMHEEDLMPMMEHLKKMKTLASDDTVLEIEYRLKNPKEGYSWFCDRNTVFKRNHKKIPVEKIGICQNITLKKKQEDEKQTSLSIIQQSEQVVAMGSWEYDIPTDEFKWSEGMYRLFNMDYSIEVRPEIYLEYTPANERPVVDELINNILHDFAPFEETITLVISEHEKKIVKIKAVVDTDKYGKPVKVIGVDLDITQQVKATGEINNLYNTLLKKNRDLQIFDIEIKTFNTISALYYKETLQQLYTNLEYIVSKDARQLSDAGKANIRRAQSAIQKMHLLTDDMNTYFKLYDLDFNIAFIDPNPLVKTLINNYQAKLEQYNAAVEFSDLPSLPTHAVLFSQLIGHLIDRAVKSRNLNVPLVIKIKYSQADELNSIAAASKNTPYGIISVSDNSIGFLEEEADKMFEILFHLSENAKRKGYGIGMAICKKIMSLHGGFISAEGSPARGAVFTCYFPLVIQR